MTRDHLVLSFRHRSMVFFVRYIDNEKLGVVVEWLGLGWAGLGWAGLEGYAAA